ncbi:immunity 49 family protein [Myxococcus sp. AM009]|nr:immunity 49 family protein [Myxococcus sp. AM009]NVJ12653.1 immunity 49 family protein [Myxococcus sp. AM010]
MSSLRPTPLEVIRDDTLFSLGEALRSLRVGDAREQSGEAYSTVALCHRRLAFCALLAQADVGRFATHLCHSGRARLQFLQLVAAGHGSEPLYRCASKAFSFIDALTAGQLDLAVEIARLEAGRSDPSHEYEEDFLLHHFLHRFTMQLHAGVASELSGILDRWESVLQGKEDGYLMVCRALHARSALDFNQAMEGVIAERILTFKNKPRDEGPNDELRRTEGAIFMNGLALLRLAELCGLETFREYPTLPGMARVPLGGRLPPVDGWRAPLTGTLD